MYQSGIEYCLSDSQVGENVGVVAIISSYGSVGAACSRTALIVKESVARQRTFGCKPHRTYAA